MPNITADNIVMEAEKLRDSNAFQQYLIDFDVNLDAVFTHCGIKLDQPICDQATAFKFAFFCQCLWESLPDRPDIRQPVFFDICDFAEYHCYGEGEEDEDEAEPGSDEPYLVG